MAYHHELSQGYACIASSTAKAPGYASHPEICNQASAGPPA
jgi:hypothetical protein